MSNIIAMYDELEHNILSCKVRCYHTEIYMADISNLLGAVALVAGNNQHHAVKIIDNF